MGDIHKDNEKRAIGDTEVTAAQFRALANSIPNLAWMADADGWIFWYNQRWYDYTGTTPEEMVGWGWQSVHHPDILPEMLRRWTHALSTGEAFEMTFPLRRGSDGSFRVFVTRAEPMRENGRIMGWFGTNTDITEQERTRERLQLVVNELNHRVKNMLATVQSIAFSSFHRASPEAYRIFEKRLMSLARVHELLARESWSKTSLEQIIQVAIETFNAERFTVNDCEAMVEPRVAAALGMTLHELCTNATKYGALSVPEGRVRIDCTLDYSTSRTRLTLLWTEEGGPVLPDRKPSEGFGLKLIKHAAGGDTGASVEHLFKPGGVECRIVLPIDDGALR